jgi:hypothetical protein
VRTQSLRKSAVRVNQKINPKSNHPGTRLIPLVLQREGHPDEIFYTPECAACGRPILDLRMANISTVAETEEDLIPVGRLGDAAALLIPSEGAYAFHKDCDETGRSPWVTAHCVFRNDQRREFEKHRGVA